MDITLYIHFSKILLLNYYSFRYQAKESLQKEGFDWKVFQQKNSAGYSNIYF